VTHIEHIALPNPSECQASHIDSIQGSAGPSAVILLVAAHPWQPQPRKVECGKQDAVPQEGEQKGRCRAGQHHQQSLCF
jgi:hypothetical protein